MASVVGSAWSSAEINVLIDAYKEMLAAELAGEHYVKRRFNEVVQARTERSRAAIEFKFCNISAALRDLERAYILGYKPRDHYQADLLEAVRSRLEEFPATSDWQAPDEETLPSEDEIAEDVQSAVEAAAEDEDQRRDRRVAALVAWESVTTLVDDGENDRVEGRNDDFWARVGRLWDRSTGGQDVADKPTEQSDSPDDEQQKGLESIVAPRPAGVEEACEWFDEGRESAAVPRMLFLIGGPGAGKSHAARALVGGMRRIHPKSDGLAHRTYEYESRGLNTVLVNDATIPSDEYEEASLAEEITASARGHKHLIACVNRGILVEEERSLLSLNSSKLEPGQALVKWLGTQGDSSIAGSWTVVTRSSSDYLITGQLSYGNEVVAEIAGVFVDVCSLLERKPNVVRGTAGEFTPEPYKINDFVERLSWDDQVTSAGHLMMEVLDSLHSVDRLSDSPTLNPIVANIQSLQSRAVRAGFLATLRAAEIVNGQRFTYREIWGAIVRAIVGPLPESISTEELRSYFDDGLMYSDSPIDDFEGIIKRANLRFSQSIYGTTSAVSKSPSDPRRNPVTRLTHVIDPMKDAIPGSATHDPSTGWASIVTEAFSGPSAEGSPLRSLTDELGKSEYDPFNDALTDFDWEVDEAYMRVMNYDGTKDAERAKYIHWYGAYLGRHYAISHGIPAFRTEIKLWTEAWYSSPQLPRSLSGGLRALLRPKRNPRDSDSKSLIPILDSRTDPIVGTVKEPKIALQTGNFEMKTRTEAESLFLLLFEQTTEISRMPLDLALTREAGACALEYPGMTELTETTSPRLERFRSARLIPDNLDRDQYRIVHGDGDTILTVAMPQESSEAN